MKKLISILLGFCLILSLSAIPAMAAPADLTSLIEESLTRQASFAITENLNIPQALEDGTVITWESSNPNVISTTGVVTRQLADTEVTLTASAAGETKPLKFTVIGKGKKVWYSENFNVPSTEVGVELGNRQVAATLSDISVEYKAATESDPGRAGFVNYLNNANDNDKISVQANPTKTGDGALCLEKKETTSNSSVATSFQIPSLTTDDLPGGNIKLFVRIISPETTDNGACQLSFGLTNESEYQTYIAKTQGSTTETGLVMTWRYLYNGKLYDVITNGTASSNLVTGLSATNGYYSNLLTHEANFDTGIAKITAASDGATVTNRQMIFVAPGDKKSKGLYFATPSSTAKQMAYIDDVVIMTDEIDASTDAEGVEIYKELLTDAFENAVADVNNVTADFSLNLVDEEGYSVSWVSNNESAIKIDSANKTADVQLSEIIRPVTLTATIAKGEATETAAFDLTVVPYGSTIKSLKAEGEYGVIDYTGKARDDAYSASDPEIPYLHNGSATYNIVKDPVTSNEYIKIPQATTAAGINYYHRGVGSGLSGVHKTVSSDIYLGAPEAANRDAVHTLSISGGNSAVMATVEFHHNKDKSGNESKWISLKSGAENIIVSDPAIVPDYREWINVQFVLNNTANKYDFYIDGVKVNSKALDYPSLGTAATPTTSIYQCSYIMGASSEEMYIDNIQILVNDETTYANPGAELMNASIGSFSEALAATGTNNSTITWTASGDAAISGTALTKTKAFGLGKAVATASVETTQGTLSRPCAIEYGTGVKEINNDGTKLTSVIYSAESAGKGYIALYNNEDRLLDVAAFDVAAGTDVINFVNKTLPTGYDSCKAFVWTSGLKPLGYVYP